LLLGFLTKNPSGLTWSYLERMALPQTPDNSGQALTDSMIKKEVQVRRPETTIRKVGNSFLLNFNKPKLTSHAESIS